MSQRYFLTTESAYEKLRLDLDAQLGYPKADAVSIFTPALQSPRDSLRRIVLAVDDGLPHYAEIVAKIEPLLASASAQELTEAEYLAFLVCVSEGGGVPLAHAASHAVGGADPVFDQDLNTTDTVGFYAINAVNGGRLVNDQGGEYAVDVGSTGNPEGGYITLSGVNDNATASQSVTINAHGVTFPDSSVQTTAYNGKIGTVAGLVLKTGTDGVIEALAQGTAGQVLKINSGATGVEWGTAAADVSIDTTAADILSASSGSITADDPGADRLVFWDDSAGKLTHLTAGTGLSISGTTITASVSASDISAGTLAYARMADPTVTSPSQITGSQNDYASFARGINRFTTNGAYNLTGMAAGNDGEVRVLTNVGTTAANTLTIKDQSSSSTAANRFSVPWNGDCVIPAEGSVVVFYDGTSSRWRVV